MLSKGVINMGTIMRVGFTAVVPAVLKRAWVLKLIKGKVHAILFILVYDNKISSLIQSYGEYPLNNCDVYNKPLLEEGKRINLDVLMLKYGYVVIQ